VLTVDLNCDMGEGMPTDGSIFPFISSANIACGGHAGGPETMRRSVELALQNGVAAGAHPSYPDRDGFGRNDILESQPGAGDKALPFHTLLSMLTAQIGALQSICREMGTRLHHVKPHGALYNRAARDPAVSRIICAAVSPVRPPPTQVSTFKTKYLPTAPIGRMAASLRVPNPTPLSMTPRLCCSRR